MLEMLKERLEAYFASVDARQVPHDLDLGPHEVTELIALLEAADTLAKHHARANCQRFECPELAAYQAMREVER